MLGIDIEEQKRAKESYDRIKLYDGAIEALKELKRSKHMILITNAHRKTLNIKLEKYDLSPYFDEMICSHELNYVKEDLQLWHILKSKFNLDYSKTVLVEDTLKNIKVGLSSGISSAIYLGSDQYSLNERIIRMSNITDIPSTFNQP